MLNQSAVLRWGKFLVITVTVALVAFFVARGFGAKVGKAAAIAVILIVACSGVWLVWVTRDGKEAVSSIGQGLLVGVVVAMAISWWQFEIQKSLDEATREQSHKEDLQGQKQNLQLSLTLQRDLVGIDLEGKDLRGLYLRDKNLREANMVGARLQWADLTGSSLVEAEMREARLEGVVLEGAHLEGAQLEEAVGKSPYFEWAKARGIKMGAVSLPAGMFGHADLEGAYMVKAEIQHGFFIEAHLEGALGFEAKLRGAHLERSHLKDADLTGADLRDAHLTEADLRDVELGAADLRGADLSGARLRAATFDDDTQWPQGFRPLAHGAVWRR